MVVMWLLVWLTLTLTVRMSLSWARVPSASTRRKGRPARGCSRNFCAWRLGLFCSCFSILVVCALSRDDVAFRVSIGCFGLLGEYSIAGKRNVQREENAICCRYLLLFLLIIVVVCLGHGVSSGHTHY